MARTLGNVTVECTVGDIVKQADMAAVVNAANAELGPGGGVAGAIHRAAGPDLDRECRPLAPIQPGQAVITGGHKLPNAHVIHCLGPVYGADTPSDALLRDCYRNALDLAERHRIDSIAVPAISTGAFGYPMQDAAHQAMHEVVRQAPGLRHVRHIRFVVTDERTRQIHDQALDAAADRQGGG